MRGTLRAGASRAAAMRRHPHLGCDLSGLACHGCYWRAPSGMIRRCRSRHFVIGGPSVSGQLRYPGAGEGRRLLFAGASDERKVRIVGLIDIAGEIGAYDIGR
jgi:hypothetical protein